MPAADIPLIDDDTIEDRVWKSDLPAVIDFWEPDSEDYCNKEKVLAAVADRYAGRVYVYRVDMRHGESAAAWAGMRAFPVLAFARKKEILETSISILRTTELVRLIDRNLKKPGP